jgi:hypothetical protein
MATQRRSYMLRFVAVQMALGRHMTPEKTLLKRIAVGPEVVVG